MNPPAPPPVVELAGVTKTFVAPDGTEQVAIRDVTFRVDDLPGRGELVVLLGPSGCGKSTILNLIAGLRPVHPATSGTVRVCGREVTGPGPDRGMVFQAYSSFPCYTVLDNVAFGLALRGMPREQREAEARRWIERVRLRGSEGRYPHQLSGGMRQRVAIARTLAVHPRVILMDEPFGALDRVVRWEMQDLLLELWRDVEATVFLVTHDIAEAVYLGDRIYVLSNAPATILEEIKVTTEKGRAAETQRTRAFADLVADVSQRVEKRQALGRDAGTPDAAPAATSGAGASAAARVEQHACPGCGAPLVVALDAERIVCPKCQGVVKVRRRA